MAKPSHLRVLVALAVAALVGSALVLFAATKPAEAVVQIDDDENGSSAGHQDSRDHQTLLETQETDCIEVPFFRLGSTEAVREIVPSNYTVREVRPGNVALTFIEYHCESITVDGKHSLPTTVTLGSVPIVSRDGEPLSGTGYVLWLGTDNPILAARYRQLGIPAEFVPHSSFTFTQENVPGVGSKVRFDLIGDRLDHAVESLVITEPAQGPIRHAQGGVFVYEGNEGWARLSFFNDVRPPGAATTSATIEPTSEIASLLASPLTFTGRTQYIRGDWTGTTQLLEQRKTSDS